MAGPRSVRQSGLVVYATQEEFQFVAPIDGIADTKRRAALSETRNEKKNQQQNKRNREMAPRRVLLRPQLVESMAPANKNSIGFYVVFLSLVRLG